MSQKSHRQHQSKPCRPNLFWLATGSVMLVVAITLITWFSYNTGSSPSSGGTPKLVVDQTSVDEGYLKFDTPVRTTFRLKNEGGGALRILGEPVVQLVEGC